MVSCERVHECVYRLHSPSAAREHDRDVDAFEVHVLQPLDGIVHAGALVEFVAFTRRAHAGEVREVLLDALLILAKPRLERLRNLLAPVLALTAVAVGVDDVESELAHFKVSPPSGTRRAPGRPASSLLALRRSPRAGSAG